MPLDKQTFQEYNPLLPASGWHFYAKKHPDDQQRDHFDI
jgi:hypothetical protein